MFLSAHTAYAQTFAKVQANPQINSVVTKILANIAIPIVEGLFFFTLLIFIWGVVQLIMNADDSEARKDGQRHILWGVVGLFIMISSYAIIRVIINTVCPDSMIQMCDPFSR